MWEKPLLSREEESEERMTWERFPAELLYTSRTRKQEAPLSSWVCARLLITQQDMISPIYNCRQPPKKGKNITSLFSKNLI
ncbi:hypothetical protein CEXT_782861 [Caerostris extrusa]|uniref:Ycf15 n=1 Tax=Caerostris extrusa TaxID=172846 RepID=A0AAV4RXP0_CAEEX|nr:hypothetical protein CEXT_782861 [Caerostris extrusa]